MVDLDGINVGMTGVTPSIVEVVSFLQHELSDIVVDINPGKTAALPPKGQVPMPDDVYLLRGK